MTDERHWEQCETCHFCSEMRSHPCSDKKPVSNSIGFACTVGLIMQDRDTSIIYPNWNPKSIQCELHLKKNSIKIKFEEIKTDSDSDHIRGLFHKLWTKDVRTEHYDKKDWNELRGLLKRHNINV